MFPPAPDNSFSDKPTPERLAGVYLEVAAEEDLTVRPYQAPQPPAASTANGPEPVTADQLAGVYLHVEAPEDLTVRPPVPDSSSPKA